MGWSYCGTDSEGREIGYAIEATCDKEGCEAEIDRGLAYACGGYHGAGDDACDQYFCAAHLVFTLDGSGKISSPQLCEECAERFEEKP